MSGAMQDRHVKRLLIALVVGAVLAAPSAAFSNGGTPRPTLEKREAWRALWRKNPPVPEESGDRLSVRDQALGPPEFRRVRRDVVRINLSLRHSPGCLTFVQFGVRERSERRYNIRQRGEATTICVPSPVPLP